MKMKKLKIIAIIIRNVHALNDNNKDLNKK